MSKTKSARPAILILLVLALGATTLEHLASGSISTTSACFHLAGAIVVAWAGVSLVGSVIDNYRLAVMRREEQAAANTGSRPSGA
jgi:hypothetical protein